MLRHERALADPTAEVAGGQGHHHGAGERSLRQAGQVLTDGEDRVGAIVLDRIGPVGVGVEDDTFVGAAFDQAHHVAADDPFRGRVEGEADRPARGGQ